MWLCYLQVNMPNRENYIPILIIGRLEKIYAFVYYVQYRCVTALGSLESGESNAVFPMAILECFLLLELISRVALLTGRAPIAFPKISVVIAYLLFLLVTYLTLVHKH